MDMLKSIGKGIYKDVTGRTADSGSGETYYITAIRAEGIKNKDRFTKSDPYLTIQFGGKSVRTRTINNDLSPNWNETFTFNTSGRKDIKLKLKDSDVGLDDTIGVGMISGGELPMYSGEEKYLQIPVTRHEEVHGIIHLKIKKVGGAINPSQSSGSGVHQQTYTQSTTYQPQPSSYQQPPPSHQPYQQTTYQQQHYQSQQPLYQQPYQQQQQPPLPQSQIYPQQNYQQQPPPYQNNIPYQNQQQPNYQTHPQQNYPYGNPNPQYSNKPYNQYNQGYGGYH